MQTDPYRKVTSFAGAAVQRLISPLLGMWKFPVSRHREGRLSGPIPISAGVVNRFPARQQSRNRRQPPSGPRV